MFIAVILIALFCIFFLGVMAVGVGMLAALKRYKPKDEQ